MNKIFAEAGFLNVSARGLIHFKTGEAASGGNGVEHDLHSRVAAL